MLLGEFRRKAAKMDWIVAQVEAGTDRSLRELLGEALYAPLSDLARPGAGRRLLKSLKTAVSFKASYDTTGTWTFGVDLAGAPGGGADTGILDTDLKKLINDLADAAKRKASGSRSSSTKHQICPLRNWQRSAQSPTRPLRTTGVCCSPLPACQAFHGSSQKQSPTPSGSGT